MTKAKKPTTQPKKTGRPSKLTDELLETILKRLADGDTLAEICRSEGMPAVRTVNDWKNSSEALSAAFARAREDGEDVIAARLRLVARGVEGHSSGDVQRDKIIIDTDLKLLAKWNPKKYGDKQQIDMNVTQHEQRLADLDQLDGHQP